MNTKRLLQAVSGTRRYIAISVIMQVVALVVNIFMIFVIADFAQALLDANFQLAPVCMAIGAALLLRLICQYLQTWANYRSSIAVKQRLRIALFDKAYAYGVSYSRYISPAELVQIGVEGVEQLDNYYGRFLPQLVYALLAPIILFGFLVRLNIVVALVLVAFIPIIPLAIVLVQKLAKRVMNSYWGSFIGLAERFLDNVQGLVTLKVYGADEDRNEAMNREAEAFRVATMRVLGMQLSNIAVMDVVAYGGAALGTFAAIVAFSRGDLSVSGCLAFMLLSAEFFLPLRQLGSFFHVAMNGLSAVDRLFSVLDKPAAPERVLTASPDGVAAQLEDVHFGYDIDNPVLKGIDLTIHTGELVAVVGASGCGKSTLAALLSGEYDPTSGRICYMFGSSAASKNLLADRVARIDAEPWLFSESVRDNLRMADAQADDEKLWHVLKQVRLAERFAAEDGLDTLVREGGANLSGGQRQRLAIARLLLKEADLYIFDEATSNVDAESEAVIMEVVQQLCSKASVLLITHRLQLTLAANRVAFMQGGYIVEEGRAEELLAQNGLFAEMFNRQSALESYGQGQAQRKETIQMAAPEESLVQVTALRPQRQMTYLPERLRTEAIQ